MVPVSTHQKIVIADAVTRQTLKIIKINYDPLFLTAPLNGDIVVLYAAEKRKIFGKNTFGGFKLLTIKYMA